MTTHTIQLEDKLTQLRLPSLRDNYQDLAKHVIAKGLGHVDYLEKLIDGELAARIEHGTQRRIKNARFPYHRTLDQFDFTCPAKIDRLLVEHLFRLDFIKNRANVIFLGTCGLGKTHLAIALGIQACTAQYNVLFTSAIDMINRLADAQASHRIDAELKRYLKPQLLIIDELGYLPIDKFGADLLFQVISKRYQNGSIVLTTNRVFKDWPNMFHDDSVFTAALLDRLLHHHELVKIEGNSYRMRKPTES